MCYTMKSKFRERILNERCVDTRKYRYIIVQGGGRYQVIKRLPIEWLGTTYASNNWETVEIL